MSDIEVFLFLIGGFFLGFLTYLFNLWINDML